jgi:hypothetical protein
LNELESTRAALRNVGEVPSEQLSEMVTTWARDVWDLSYDMEDTVDTFLVHVQGGSEPPSKRSAKRFVKKMIEKLTKATIRHEIGQEIKNIKERVKEVADRRDRLVNLVYLHFNSFIPKLLLLRPLHAHTGTRLMLSLLQKPCWLTLA